MKNILVAIDLTDSSVHALDRSIHIARRRQSNLHVFHRVQSVNVSPEDIGDLVHEYEMRVMNYVLDRPEAADISVTIHVSAHGRLHECIADVAHKIMPDLILLGSVAGYDTASSFVSSTIEKVVRRSEYPVLMVARPGNTDYQKAAVYTGSLKFPKNSVEALCKLNDDLDINILIKKMRIDYSDGPRSLFQKLRYTLRSWKEASFRSGESAVQQAKEYVRQHIHPKYVGNMSSNELLRQVCSEKFDLAVIHVGKYADVWESRLGGLAAQTPKICPLRCPSDKGPIACRIRASDDRRSVAILGRAIL